MTTTINKETVTEQLLNNTILIEISGDKYSEHIYISQERDIIEIDVDKISFLISSLERFIENGKITDK